MIILQFAALLSFYNDKTRHLDAWLVTQNMSRRQILLSKIFWLIIAPIAFAAMIDLLLTITMQPSDWTHALRSNIINGTFSLLFASLVLGVSLVIGPIWQKVAEVSILSSCLKLSPTRLRIKCYQDSILLTI